MKQQLHQLNQLLSYHKQQLKSHQQLQLLDLQKNTLLTMFEAACKNGRLEFGEECDDGDVNSAMQSYIFHQFIQSCNEYCRLATGVMHYGSPGQKSFGSLNDCSQNTLTVQHCYDHNIDNGDGCSNQCKVDPLWSCYKEFKDDKNDFYCFNKDYQNYQPSPSPWWWIEPPTKYNSDCIKDGVLSEYEQCDNGLTTQETGYLLFIYNFIAVISIVTQRWDGLVSQNYKKNLIATGPAYLLEQNVQTGIICTLDCYIEWGYGFSVKKISDAEYDYEIITFVSQTTTLPDETTTSSVESTTIISQTTTKVSSTITTARPTESQTSASTQVTSTTDSISITDSPTSPPPISQTSTIISTQSTTITTISTTEAPSVKQCKQAVSLFDQTEGTADSQEGEQITCASMSICPDGSQPPCNWRRKTLTSCQEKDYAQSNNRRFLGNNSTAQNSATMRIKTNSLPNHCFQTQETSIVKENDIDFEVE
ncbi:UNKNOWN [Stylonychia lemnae]|uniref:Uncharacterized protein n=1 Tax=Stylonychia lemnae TaxID=5949 RepID=A0A078A370_STYLE|nr:UNKNOWN [Stylonychia lemnae]|eukprot:CDW76723.1 UNKNOWN [Stylonychia lemnae]